MPDLDYLVAAGSIRSSPRTCAKCQHLPSRHVVVPLTADPEFAGKVSCDARYWGKGADRCGCKAFVPKLKP